MRVLLVDAFDSFSHIIYQYLRMAGAEVRVVRSGELRPDEILAASEDAVVLGPGPGHPAKSGHVEILQAVAGAKPVLGICLGHQAIALAYEGTVDHAFRPMHGKSSLVRHDGQGLFAGLEGELSVVRYHSLAVSSVSTAGPLAVTAEADDGTVMGLRHRTLPVEGVQFHPESISTDTGFEMIANFVQGGRS
ncbi:anthranilate synthase component II [Nocardiopsis alba]|uniref:anthranilate synthase component II n=1 Tax=Nocardiopsis alba TaxID=53437 RepID=UPI003670113F